MGTTDDRRRPAKAGTARGRRVCGARGGGRTVKGPAGFRTAPPLPRPPSAELQMQTGCQEKESGRGATRPLCSSVRKPGGGSCQRLHPPPPLLPLLVREPLPPGRPEIQARDKIGWFRPTPRLVSARPPPQPNSAREVVSPACPVRAQRGRGPPERSGRRPNSRASPPPMRPTLNSARWVGGGAPSAPSRSLDTAPSVLPGGGGEASRVGRWKSGMGATPQPPLRPLS